MLHFFRNSLKNESNIGILLLFFSFTVNAQNPVIDRTFKSGFTANSSDEEYYNLDIHEINDTLISLVINSKDTGSLVKYGVRYVLSKSDLSAFRIDTLWDLNKLNVLTYPTQNRTYHPLNLFLKDEVNNATYELEYYTDTTFKQVITFFTLDGLGNRIDTVVSILTRNESMTNNPFIYDSLIYVTLSNFTGDSTILRVYDFDGSIVNSRRHYHGAGGTLFGGPLRLQQPVEPLPSNDSMLVYPYIGTSSGIQLINRFTLDTAGWVYIDGFQSANLANQYGLRLRVTTGYAFFNSYFVMGGYCKKLTYVGPGNLLSDYTFFRIEMTYDGQILDVETFGNDSIDERSYDYFIDNNTDYFIGSSPFAFPNVGDAEYRQLLLLKRSSSFQDSLLFYGNSNHVGLSACVDNNEDVYILSRYSNAWTNDSIFTVITKVPNSLLVSVKEYNPNVSSLVVYPNPTRDQLQVDGAETGEFYRIVSITGQIVLEGTLIDNKTIDVGVLKAGTYFLQLESQQAAVHRANVFIKE